MITYTEVIDELTGSKSIKADLGNGASLSIPCDPANSDYQTYLKTIKPKVIAE